MQRTNQSFCEGARIGQIELMESKVLNYHGRMLKNGPKMHAISLETFML